MREFYDRLIDDKDREWFFNEVRSNVNKNLQETFDVVFNNLSDSSVCNCVNNNNNERMKTITLLIDV